MPNADYDWNCKYKSSIEKTSQVTLKASNGGKAGYLTVRVEAFGFGGTINIIGQKNDQWINYVEGTTAATADVRVYTNAEFSQKYFFPADWDVFVTFEPTQNYGGKKFTSSSGKFAIYSAFQGEITLGDKSIENPKYICYDPKLIAYVEPVVSCDLDPDQDKCIKTCA